jgi:hypothetical protein
LNYCNARIGDCTITRNICRPWPGSFGLVLVMMKSAGLDKMYSQAPLEIQCTAIGGTHTLETIRCSDLASGLYNSYLSFSFCIQSVTGQIANLPFILTCLPYQLDEIACLSCPVNRVGLFQGIDRTVLLFLLQCGRLYPKEIMRSWLS